jgi:hypothetical protein
MPTRKTSDAHSHWQVWVSSIEGPLTTHALQRLVQRLTHDGAESMGAVDAVEMVEMRKFGKTPIPLLL